MLLSSFEIACQTITKDPTKKTQTRPPPTRLGQLSVCKRAVIDRCSDTLRYRDAPTDVDVCSAQRVQLQHVAVGAKQWARKGNEGLDASWAVEAGVEN